MDQYQQYIHKSRYARYLDDEAAQGGRGTRPVNRYVEFLCTERDQIDQGTVAVELFNAIYDHEGNAFHALYDDRRDGFKAGQRSSL